MAMTTLWSPEKNVGMGKTNRKYYKPHFYCEICQCIHTFPHIQFQVQFVK